MSYSLNEVEAHSKRAARGAGLDWGLAEEAAKATRWLCAQGLDGCRVLANLLDVYQTNPQKLGSPLSLTGEWHGSAELLCPVRTGASLSDCAQRVTVDGVEIRNLSNPLIILPFVAAAARRTNTCLQVTWADAIFTTDGKTHKQQFATDTAAYVKQADCVAIAHAAALIDGAKSTHRATPSSQVWETLNSLAALTYAPATETSRRLGAGAGQSDND